VAFAELDRASFAQLERVFRDTFEKRLRDLGLIDDTPDDLVY
jgi:hypothetical protein